MKRYVIINIFIFSSLFYSQGMHPKPMNINYEFNLSSELSVLYSTKIYTNINKEIAFNDIYPVSLYFSGLIYFSKNLAFEFKPGIVFGGEYYSGFEYGLYLRYYLIGQKYYASLGLNIHDNLGGGHGVSRSVSSTEESISFLGVKIAYKPKLYFAFTLGYFYPLEEEYSYFSISEANGDRYTGFLNHLVKLGFEFSF